MVQIMHRKQVIIHNSVRTRKEINIYKFFEPEEQPVHKQSARLKFEKLNKQMEIVTLSMSTNATFQENNKHPLLF